MSIGGNITAAVVSIPILFGIGRLAFPPAVEAPLACHSAKVEQITDAEGNTAALRVYVCDADPLVFMMSNPAEG